jgi:tetratricopeptide (TPR) repeat protein
MGFGRRAVADAALAAALMMRVLSGMTDPETADLARVNRLVGQALAASPRNAYSHLVKGAILRAQNRWEEAIPEYETALALNHNLVHASFSLGWCKLYAGSIEDVIPLVEQAIRLSPRDPLIGYWYGLIGNVHLLQSQIDEAIIWFQKAGSVFPASPVFRSRLAAAYALRGETERGAAELAEARRLDGGDRFSSIADLKASRGAWLGVAKIGALYEVTYFAGLRKAGMPED